MQIYEKSSRIEDSQTSSVDKLPKIVSLFCGAGGLDWGFYEQGFEIALAVDISKAAIETHRRNFPETVSFAADLLSLGPDGVFELVKANIKKGSRIGVIGGPPCQGFSRANTASSKNDPRNKMPSLYLEIVAKFQGYYDVEFVVFENVLGIRDKKHRETYESLVRGLAKLSFDITEKELCALDFGVPQARKRIILSALKKGKYRPVLPQHTDGPKTVGCVIAGLPEPVFYSRSLTSGEIPFHANHWTMKPKSDRFLNPSKTYAPSRSFKKLCWSKPSPTVAYGNREIHVHPEGRRRLSIYEAMLLQGFPKEFVLMGNLSQQVEQVSNAVPPPLSSGIAKAVKIAMEC